MAKEWANLMGGVSADQIFGMRPDEQNLLIDGRHINCKQVRYSSDELFESALRGVTIT